MSADDFQLMFNKWDVEVTQLILGLEKRCNKFWNGSIKFSPGHWYMDMTSSGIPLDSAIS